MKFLLIQCDEIRKISAGQGDDYTYGCLLDFAYFGKNYGLIATDLSKQKALDADSRAIQQIIFTGKVKGTVANTIVIIYFILEKSKETVLEFSKETISSVITIKMVEYNIVNVKLSDTQLKKIKNAVKNKTGTTLRINFKIFNGNNLPHELLLTTR